MDRHWQRDLEGEAERIALRLPEGMRRIFTQSYLCTAKTTVQETADGRIFIVTGDIPAMWLRDSAAQVHHYLPAAAKYDSVYQFIRAVLSRQFFYIEMDPYANAFNETANGNHWDEDKTDMKPDLWERKYEIDSLCFPIELAYLYWQNSGKTSIFDEKFMKAAKTVVSVFRTEQDHENKSTYSFERMNCVFTDTLSREGKGALVKPNTGLIWSGFRPSDDSCVYGYLIPSNMLAVVILEYLSKISSEIYKDEEFAKETLDFAGEIREAIEREAIVRPGGYRFFNPFYAYEVDGYGEVLVMDDANLPSLLSAPYFGYCSADSQIYKNTKEIILSSQNPYYYEGEFASGIGSMHTPSNSVWHISMGMEGLVSGNRGEKRYIIERMADTDGGTGWMHESFGCDDPTQFTRPWFSWANAIFCELVMDYCGYKIKR